MCPCAITKTKRSQRKEIIIIIWKKKKKDSTVRLTTVGRTQYPSAEYRLGKNEDKEVFPHCVFPSPHPKPEDAQNLLGHRAGVRSEIMRKRARLEPQTHMETIARPPFTQPRKEPRVTGHREWILTPGLRVQPRRPDSECEQTFGRRKREHYLNIIILSLYWICYNVASVAYVLFLFFFFFYHEACGISAPRPGIEASPLALEGKVLGTGSPRKCL